MQSQPIQSQPDPSPLLEQLKDIHSVPEPGLWPPAPGWWFLAAIALIVLAYMLRVAWQKYRVAQRRKKFIQVLNGLRVQFDPATSPHDYLAAMNRFFRAIALRAFAPAYRG